MSERQFSSERELTRTAVNTPFFKRLISDSIFSQFEMRGVFGIPDLVLAYTDATRRDIYGISFEMKLHRWRKAIRQAYRYKSFSSKAYVVIDEACSRAAKNNLHRFRQFNVGLVTISTSGEITMQYEPKYEAPFSNRLKSIFQSIVASSRESALKKAATSQNPQILRRLVPAT